MQREFSEASPWYSRYRKAFPEVITLEKVSLYIQHCSNPLHIYCWLRKAGFNKSLSMSLCRGYEQYIFIWLRLVVLFAITSYRKRWFKRLFQFSF
jgi:hypothetical protein